MKKINNFFKKADKLLSIWAENYIYRVSRTLYPKPHLDEEPKRQQAKQTKTKQAVGEEEDEPILFI